MDKRSPVYPRVNVNLPVEVSYADRISHERATSLGGEGMFLAVTTPLPPGTEIGIRFRPAKHLPIIEVKAKVMYQITDVGTGVKFTEIDPQHRQALLRLILHRQARTRQCARAHLVAQIECPQCTSLAFSRDISEGGMFIETKKPLPVDSEVRLRFNLADGGPCISALAEVVYEVVDLGMGLQFTEVSPEERKRIANYVSESGTLPDPKEHLSSA